MSVRRNASADVCAHAEAEVTNMRLFAAFTSARAQEKAQWRARVDKGPQARMRTGANARMCARARTVTRLHAHQRSTQSKFETRWTERHAYTHASIGARNQLTHKHASSPSVCERTRLCPHAPVRALTSASVYK
eukprot:1573496-Pleurochrysis_carterae.AAC.7